MRPVRRAFVILLIAAAVVALGLLLSRRIRRRCGSAAPWPRRTRGSRHTWRRWSAPTCRRGNRYDVLHQRRSDLSGDARGDREGEAAHQLRDLHLRHRQRRRAVHARRSSAPRGAACTSSSSSTRWAAARSRRTMSSGCEAAGCTIVQFNAPRWYSTRGSELPHAPQDPRRRRRDRLHRRRRASPTSGSGNAQDKEHWRDTQVRIDGPDRAADRRRLLRELHRGRRRGRRRSSTTAQRRSGRRGRVVRRAQLADRRQQRSEAALPARHRRRRARRSTSPRRTSSPTNRADWALEDARQARREDPHPGRRGHHRRDAGEVRVPRGTTSSCCELGIEIYEYQPTMMHTKTLVVDGVVEHVRLGELRQPIAGAERRAERRRRRAATSPRGCWPGLRAGPAALADARARRRGGSARCSRRRASTSGAISGRSSRRSSCQRPSSELPASDRARIASSIANPRVRRSESRQ